MNEETGKEELLVRRKATAGDKDLGLTWETKESLLQDAVGPVYAERGGLFGILHDTYGKSTYDRLRVQTSYEHSLARLGLFANRAKRAAVGGISYDKGYPVSAMGAEEDTMNANGGDEDQADRSEAEVVAKSSKKKAKSPATTSRGGRSRTPSKRKGE